MGQPLITIINMQPRDLVCWCCGIEYLDEGHGVPGYEDLVLPNDWKGEWGGFPACKDCFFIQELLKEPVSLRDWPRRRPPNKNTRRETPYGTA